MKLQQSKSAPSKQPMVAKAPSKVEEKVCILLLSSNINGTKIDMISTVRKFSITHASLIFMYMYSHGILLGC